MIIRRQEKTIIPQTPDGYMFAKGFEVGLKIEGAFCKREEDTVNIYLYAEYTLNLEDDKTE